MSGKNSCDKINPFDALQSTTLSYVFFEMFDWGHNSQAFNYLLRIIVDWLVFWLHLSKVCEHFEVDTHPTRWWRLPWNVVAVSLFNRQRGQRCRKEMLSWCGVANNVSTTTSDRYLYSVTVSIILHGDYKIDNIVFRLLIVRSRLLIMVDGEWCAIRNRCTPAAFDGAPITFKVAGCFVVEGPPKGEEGGADSAPWILTWSLNCIVVLFFCILVFKLK